MLKKSSLIKAYSGIQSCTACSQPRCTQSRSNTSPPCDPSMPTKYRRRAYSTTRQHSPQETVASRWITRRPYATVRDSSSMDFRDNMNWPCKKSTQGPNPFVPSPYEIFEMSKTTTYSKATKLKYFELVKIYHPDRNGHNVGCEGLSQGERLERYRLIVLAHEILSDPTKRRAYDSHGAGWGYRASAASRHSRGYYSPATGQSYGQGQGYDNSPFSNATWEDWERWYRRNASVHTGTRQAYEGVYVNPNAFAAFVILVAILSGILQATRAGQLSSSMSERQLAFTEETSRFMTARATEFEDGKLDKDGRVRHFLERRDPTRYGLKEEEEEHYRKVFGNGEGIEPLGRSKNKANEDKTDDERSLKQP